MKNEHRDYVNSQFIKDEYYVKTEDPRHMVDIVNSSLELRRDKVTNMYSVVAILGGGKVHVICRSESEGHCRRVFKDMKQTKQHILELLRRQRQ